MISKALCENRHVDLAACLCNAAQELLIILGQLIHVHVVPLPSGMGRIFEMHFDELFVKTLILQRLHTTSCHG